MNWNAVLQWSIAQTNGEFNKDIKPMDQSTRKWIEEALESGQVDEFKRMAEILEQLSVPEDNDEPMRLQLLLELEEILDGLDRANDFCKMDGIKFLFEYSNRTTMPTIRLECLKLIGSCSQNNTYVQQWAVDNGLMSVLEMVTTEDIKLREQVYSLLSSLVRGECLNAKRQFIDMHGIQRILKYLSTPKCMAKCINIIRDLLNYDDELHRTYHDISKFSNTNAAKVVNNANKNSLQFDNNDELQKQNEEPKNQKYRNIVKQILIDAQFTKITTELLNNTSYEQSDTRIGLLECLIAIMKVKHHQGIAEQVQNHLNALLKSTEVDQNEILMCKQLLLIQ